MCSNIVSVVIPCYNCGATILKTVDSVKCQSHPYVQIIIVDDGSSDPDTITILDDLTDVILIRQQNIGLPAARNAGIRWAGAGYILPLDADDWLEPNAIEVLLAPFRADSFRSFTYSHIMLEGELSGTLSKSYNFFEQLFSNQIPYSILMPYWLWLHAGGYDETMTSGYEDWEFNIRLSALGHFGVVIPEPLLHYRVSINGMLISRSNQLHGVLWRYIQSKHKGLYSFSYLLSLWVYWRNYPSTYPLLLYIPWLLLHRILPDTFFSSIFRLIRSNSHSRRLPALS